MFDKRLFDAQKWTVVVQPYLHNILRINFDYWCDLSRKPRASIDFVVEVISSLSKVETL